MNGGQVIVQSLMLEHVDVHGGSDSAARGRGSRHTPHLLPAARGGRAQGGIMAALQARSAWGHLQ